MVVRQKINFIQQEAVKEGFRARNFVDRIRSDPTIWEKI